MKSYGNKINTSFHNNRIKFPTSVFKKMKIHCQGKKMSKYTDDELKIYFHIFMRK